MVMRFLLVRGGLGNRLRCIESIAMSDPYKLVFGRETLNVEWLSILISRFRGDVT